MKKVLFVLMLLMVIPSVGNAQRLKWEKGYYVDEFNDPDPNQPYYSLVLNEADGTGGFGFRVSRVYGLEFSFYSIIWGATSYQFKIKTNDRVVNIPIIEMEHGTRYQIDPDYFWTVVDIMAKGNYSISFVGYDDYHEEYAGSTVVRVKQQTATIRQILTKLGISR